MSRLCRKREKQRRISEPTLQHICNADLPIYKRLGRPVHTCELNILLAMIKPKIDRLAPISMLSKARLTTRQSVPPPSIRHISAMPNFTIRDIQPEVPVNVPQDSGISSEELLGFPAFKTWLSTLKHSLSLQRKDSHVFHDTPYALRRIEIQSVDRFGGGRLGFIKLKAEITNDLEERLPGSVFLRGGSVAMMVNIAVTPYTMAQLGSIRSRLLMLVVTPN